jgi:hypothetical protein
MEEKYKLSFNRTYILLRLALIGLLVSILYALFIYGQVISNYIYLVFDEVSSLLGFDIFAKKGIPNAKSSQLLIRYILIFFAYLILINHFNVYIIKISTHYPLLTLKEYTPTNQESTISFKKLSLFYIRC